MAEEVSGGMTGPNGERLELKIGTRSLGLQAKELLPLLVLMAGIVGGYLLWVSSDHRLQMLTDRQERIMGLLQADKSEIIEKLHDQQTFLLEQVQQSRQRLDDQTNAIRKMLSIHETNMSRDPGDRFPLEYPGEVGKPQPPR